MKHVWVAKCSDCDGSLLYDVFSTKKLGMIWLKKQYTRELSSVEHMNEFEEERNYHVKHIWTISSIIEEKDRIYFNTDIETYSITKWKVK